MSTPRACSLTAAPHPRPAAPSALRGYDVDFFAWTQETARALLEGRFDEIDKEALADEVESLGKRDRREAGSRLSVMVMHMLQIQYQPEMESASWRTTIKTQRRELTRILADSPSLRPQVAELLLEAYQDGRSDAADETGLGLDTFPETCPWTVAEVLGE